MPGFLVHDLAALFDDKVRPKAVQELSPLSPGDHYVVNETRRLKFVHRSRKTRNPLQDHVIAMFMRPSDGKGTKVKEAMNFFGLSRQAITDALKRHKERYPELVKTFPARAGK